MAGQFPTPSFHVPGLLDDEALQQQLKQFTDQSNRAAGQGPSPAALGMADKVSRDYIDQPLNRALKLSSALAPAPVGPALGAISTLVGRGGTPPPDPQQQALDTRSDILSNNGIGGAIGRSLIAGPLGTLVGNQSPLTTMNRLTPEEAQADADQRVEDRKNAEAAIAADADARQKLRNMSDAEAAQMGLPVAPGGTDPVTDSEQADRRAAFDAERLKQAQKDTAEAEKIAATPEAQATLPWWLNAAREALRGAERVPTSAMKTVAILNEARYGFEGGRSDMRAWVDTIDATFDKLLPADKARAKDFASKLSQGTGSLAGFLTMGALGGLAGLSTKVTTAGIGAAVNASTQFEDAEAHNATALNKYLTLFAASAIGATEALPIDRMLRRAEAATGGLVSRMLINTAANSMEEFLQEFGQNVGNDVVAQWTYDANRSIDWKGAFEQGAIGAISGGMAGAATTALTEAGVLPKAEPVETTERKEPEPVVDEAQQEDFLKRFFTQSQAVLDKMKADTAYDEQLTTPTPVAEPVPGETAERAPNDVAEPVPVEETPADIATRMKAEEVRPVTQVAEDYAKALPRPELFEPSGVTGRGGTQPRTAADGNIVLRHQARAVREELDPEQMGTGPIVGVERKRLVGPDAVGRVYFGVDSGPDFQQPAVPLKEYVKVSDEEVAAAKTLGIDKRRLVQALERRWYAARDAGQGYVDESLGPIVHEVTVGRDDLYNMAEDPLNLRARLPDDLTPPERTTRYERLVKEAGFRGALFPGRQGMGRTAILFNKETPSRVVDNRYGLPVSEIATPEDFANPTAETFQKGGWAVVTGTQEAQGPFSSEENIKANNKLRDRLTKDGVRFEEVSGTYQGTPQGTSFLIFAPESYALKLGKSLKQESILTRDGLVYSDGSDRLVPARGVVIGDEALSSDFHSTLPNGVPFSVNLDFEAEGNRDQLLGQRAANTPEAAIAAVELSPEDLKPLPGLKTGKPVESVVRAARAYAESVGLPVRRQAEYVKVDVERAKRIAQAYEDMKDEPTDPKVAAAYDAMIEETLAQYQFVKATGLKVEAIEEGQDDPYPEGPKQVLEDLERGHLWFFPTDQGFGTLTEAQKANPLLRETEEKLGDRVLVANDIFRIVHDFFGHGIEGSGFGARGEENAWQSHMRLYSEAALPAVTSETRGQNSWVNYGPHGEANRANQRETVYADQKAGIMPSWTWTEGVAEDMPLPQTASRADLYAAKSPGGTASARGPLRGEQTRPKKGIAGGTDEGRDDVSLSKLAQNVIDLLNLTARQGRFTLKGSNVVGQFSARQNVVRLKTWNDLSSLVHEGAHALEQAASPALRQWIDGNKATLEKVAKALYGGDVSKMPPKEVVSEGFAEFFRIYTLNRGFTTQKYPTLAQDFTDLLEKTDPQLKAGLDVIGDQFAAWLQLPSAQLVRNMVVSGRQTAGINAAIKELQDKGFGTWFNDLVTKTVQETTNRYAYLNKLIAELLNLGQENIGQSIDLKYADDPRVLIRLATNVGNRAMVQTTDGVMPYHDVNPTTQGLRAALLRYHGLGEDQHLKEIDPVRQKDFAAYLIALRGIDEYRRLAEGKIERPPLAATLGDLRLTVKEMNDRYGTDFAEAAKIVHEYGMALWQKAFDAGLMTRQTFKDGLDRQFYVPLQRDMSDKDVTTSDMADAMAAGKGRSIVKRFRGSDRDIIDPVDALMQKTFSLERVIAENDVKLALARLADKAGKAGALVERVPAHRLLGQEYSVQEIARQLTKDDTVSEADAQDLMTILEASIEEGNRVALFRSQQAVAGGDNIVFFWEQGKLAAVQLKDGDVGADVVNTLNGIGRENMPVFVETIAAASTAFRTAITSWPDFLLVNFIRDQASAWILTDVGYKPFATGLRGVMDEVRQNQWARQYNAAMGLMGGMNTAALHKVRVERDLDALRGKGYLVRAFSEKGITGAIKGLGRIVEVTETGSRMGIFRSAYNRAKKDGLTDWEASIEAAYLATDYIDYGLNGNKMLMWRRLVPFLNAQLQGLAKLMRTVGGGEVRQRKGLNFALRAYFKDINGLDLSRTEKLALQTGRKAILKMMSISFIGAALAMAFWDDPDYQDASEYLRATGWVIPLGDGRIFYIPKPFELAVFSNFVERGIETAAGDADAPKKFLRGVALNLTPPVAPPAIQQVIEQAANYDFFTDREIVPDYMRALAPELQYDRTTSELAKNIGSIIGVSPMRVEHTLSGVGASAYRDVSFMYNSVLGEDRPSSDVTNWPITRRFIRDARRGSQSAKDFWAYASTVNGSLRSAEVTYKTMVEEGRERAANEFLDTLDPDARAYALLNTHFKADAKRLNPFYRVRQISTIVSALRREMTSPLGVEDSTTKFSEPVKLSAKEKYEIDQVLSEYMRREMRNTLIYMQDPGWRYKTPLPTDTTFDLLDKTNAFVFDELNRRIRKANIYSADTVQEYWPEARDRLLSDREDAFLKDLTVIAKVMR